MALREFLVHTRDQVVNHPDRPVHIVLGNESCDLDSAICAISYAFFLHSTQQTTTPPPPYPLPILNIPRKQFRLRLELCYLLNQHGLGPDLLTFQDDLDPLREATSAVTLVDHHDPRDEGLRSKVVEVIDHHQLHGSLPESWRVELKLVGSCSSLVANRLLASPDFHMDATLAQLLLGTILSDTGNMSVSDGIGTPTESEAIGRLQRFLPEHVNATQIYEGIRDHKFDLSSLTVLEMLHKDLKMLKGDHSIVAISSVTMDLQLMLQRSEFAEDLRRFQAELPCDLVVLMTLRTGKSGIDRRCLAVCGENCAGLIDSLAASTSPNLDLRPWDQAVPADVSAFVQGNTRVTRKGVLPLVRAWLTKEDAARSGGVRRA